MPDQVGHEAQVAGVLGADDHGRLLHAGLSLEQRLDLAELDAIAANLDLKIRAADEVDVAVGAVSRQVARRIHARATARKRIGNEALRRQLRAIQVAARHAFAADEQLARHTDRDGPAELVEHVHARIGDRAADRDVALRRLNGMRERPNGRLRRAIHVRESALALRSELLGKGDRQRLTAEQDVRNSADRSTSVGVGEIQSRHRRRALHVRDAMRPHHAREREVGVRHGAHRLPARSHSRVQLLELRQALHDGFGVDAEVEQARDLRDADLLALRELLEARLERAE